MIERELAAEHSTPAAEQSPASEAPRPTRKAAPKPMLTLAEFFSRRAATPARFLKDVRVNNIWGFATEDIAEALEALGKSDPKFARTTGLASAALAEKDGRFATPCLDFAREASLARLRLNPRYIALDLDALESAEDRFQAIARALEGRLETAKQRPEALNLLLSTALYMVNKENLSAESAMLALVQALGARAEHGSRADVTRLAALVAVANSTKPGLMPVLQLSLPWIEASRDTAAQADESRSRAERLDAELAEMTKQHEDAVGKLRRVQSELDAAHEQVEGLRRAEVVTQEQRAHDLREMRGTIAGSLRGKLTGAIATARDALELDPPRIPVAQEKLEIAQQELERQLEWLKSLD